MLGWDVAGQVTGVGEGVEDFQPGDRVVGMAHWYESGGSVGGYAESVAFEAEWLVPLPDGLDYETAATIPLNALTARQGLELLDPRDGCDLLVTGASGAVGSFAVQLAAEAGHRVIAQAGRNDERWPHTLGAAEVLPRGMDLGAIDPVLTIFDAVPLGEAVFAAVKDGGAIVSTRRPPEAPPDRRIRQESFLVHHDREALRELVDAVAAGRFRTRVDRALPLDQAAEAHRLVEAGGLHGKIVLTS